MHQVKAMGAQKQGAKCRAAWSSGGLEQWDQAMKQKNPQADQWPEHWGRCEDFEPAHGRCNDGAPLVQGTGSSKTGDGGDDVLCIEPQVDVGAWREGQSFQVEPDYEMRITDDRVMPFLLLCNYSSTDSRTKP